MRAPGVQVVEAPFLGRSSRLLLATEILTTACLEATSTIVGRPVDSWTLGILSSSIRDILSHQMRLRGLPWDGVPCPTVDLVEDAGGYHIMTDPDWVKRTDFLLGNRGCRRCGSSLVSGASHVPEECDLVIVGDVIDS